MPDVSLPPVEELVSIARKVLEGGGTLDAASRALDAYAPAVDEVADAPAIAEWLGISSASIYRERSRTRADGSAAWPEPDGKFGRSGVWRYRTIVLHRASMPGQGSAGRGRPRRRVDGQ